MSKIKAIALDLDGTLLTSEKKISPKTGDFLMSCVKKGIKIFIATARPPRIKEMLKLENDYDRLLEGDGVFLNGGCIKIADTKSYVPISMNPDLKKLLLQGLNHKDFHCNGALQLKEEVHSLYRSLSEEEHQIWGLKKEDLLDFDTALTQNPVKIILYLTVSPLNNFPRNPDLIDSQAVTSFESYYKNFKSIPQLQAILTDQGSVIQMMNSDVNKLDGLKTILKHYNIQDEEVAVFGDDTQDIKMLSHFKYSYAMENGIDAVKKAANFITSSNDDVGVLAALKKIV